MASPFSEIIKSDIPTLVDFYTSWCAPCNSMKPILEKVKNIVGDHVKIIKIDINRNPQAANVYKINSIPTFILFKNGKIKWRQSGAISSTQLQQIILQHTS